MLRGALILQIQADRNEEEKEKGRLFSEKQAYPLMGTKNKPSSTGIIYITLPESSSATPVKHPGSHKIPSRKHSVVRKLKFIIQVAINQSAKNYCSRKTGLGKCGLYCAGVELRGTVQEAKRCGTPKCHPESAEG